MLTMISHHTIKEDWQRLSAILEAFWDTNLNFETLDNLKARLLDNSCFLWLWANDEARFLFVSEPRYTAKGTIFTVTHTAGMNRTGEPWSPKQLRSIIDTIFTDIEKLAKETDHIAVCIHARPGHVRLAEGYQPWSIPIIKKL